MKEEVRIDKWLWAMRLFKTRSIAADACKKGKIMMSGQNLKPSRTIKVGDIIQIRKSPIIYSFRVLALTENPSILHLYRVIEENIFIRYGLFHSFPHGINRCLEWKCVKNASFTPFE